MSESPLRVAEAPARDETQKRTAASRSLLLPAVRSTEPRCRCIICLAPFRWAETTRRTARSAFTRAVAHTRTGGTRRDERRSQLAVSPTPIADQTEVHAMTKPTAHFASEDEVPDRPVLGWVQVLVHGLERGQCEIR